MFKHNILLPLLAIVVLFASCVTDTEVNNPALQAAKNDKLFKTDIRKAILGNDGSITISGSSLSESINIIVSDAQEGTYTFGNSFNDVATFLTFDQIFYTTGTGGNGTIEITDISNNEISGSFRFNALKNGSGEILNFQKGWFYKIPIENASGDTDSRTCELSSMTATIDDHTLTTDSHLVQNLGDFLLAKGTTPQEEITLFFPINITVGDYPLSSSGNYSATYEINNDRASAVSGTLTIVSHDIETQCITGDFNYVTTTGVQVTNGHFEFGY